MSYFLPNYYCMDILKNNKMRNCFKFKTVNCLVNLGGNRQYLKTDLPFLFQFAFLIVMDKSAVSQSKNRGDHASNMKTPGSRKEQSSLKEQDGCVKPDGTFTFEYDKVVHSHNYQDIRDIPTGSYVKSKILRNFDPNDSIINMDKQELDQKVQSHFKGIYQNQVFDDRVGADPTKFPKLVGASHNKGHSLDARGQGAGKRVTSTDTKSKLKLMGEHKRTLTIKNKNALSPQKDDVMAQYATARKQIRDNIQRAQVQIANHNNSADRLPNHTMNHENKHANQLANMDGPHMINKPSNLTSQQALGMADTGQMPRGTTFSTLHATGGAPHEENITNASTFMGHTLAGAKNTKYRAQFRLHQNSAVNTKTFQKNTDSKDALESVSRGLNDTMDLGSKEAFQNLPQGTLSHIHSKSNQISQMTQAYGFNATRPIGVQLQNTGSGPIPFVPRSGLGTPDKFGQTQAYYPKQNPMYDEMIEMNRSMLDPSNVLRPHLMKQTPQSAINKIATNINSVRDYKFQQFDAHQDKIRRIHQKLMQKKQVQSGGNSSLNSVQRLLSQKLSHTFLVTQGQGMEYDIIMQNNRHNEMFKDMNRLNGCFLDVIDNVCGYKVEMGIMLQRLVESYNSIFLQQFEVFYDGRLQKEKELDKEIAIFQDKQKDTENEKGLLKQKQELAEKAIETKQTEIERLEDQVEQLEKTIEELRSIIRQDDKETADLKDEADKKQAELDEKEFMAKDFDRNKRVALKQNPMSSKLLLDPAIVPDMNEVLEIAQGKAEDRNAYVENLYEVIKSMLTNKRKDMKTQTDQACMNNAIMYDYYSYGDSSSEKDETKDKKDEDLGAETQDAKLKKLMDEKGIRIDEEDVDEDDDPPINVENSQEKSETGGLKLDGNMDTVNTRSNDSQRSARLSNKQSRSRSRRGSHLGSPNSGSLKSQNKKRQIQKGQSKDFNVLELPQTYHAQSLRQVGMRDKNKLTHLNEVFEKMCLKIKKKRQQQGPPEASDTSKMSFDVVWKIPFKVIAFISNRIQQLEDDPSIVENYELMPWHQLKDFIFDLYDHRVKHTPELCGSINNGYCSFNEHLMMYFVDKYRRRAKAEEKVTDIIINLKYYYEYWKRVQIYVSNLGFAKKVLPNTGESPMDKSRDKTVDPHQVNEYGDPVNQAPPHGYVSDDQLIDHDLFTQEFFLHAYSLLNHDRNNFIESREGKTWIRTKTHDIVSKKIIPLMKGPVGDIQKWSLKMRRLTRKIKNKDGVEYEYLDLDLILYMMVDDFKQQRILFQKEIQKQFARSVEASQEGLDLDGFMEMLTASMPPTDEAQALEHPLISYPGQISYVRAYIFACTAGADNGTVFSDDCFLAGASRFGLESPVASISTRCGFYGNSRDIMQMLQDAEQNFGRPIKLDSKQFTSFTMGLPEKKNFKKRSVMTSRQGLEGSDKEDADMRRKRTIEVNETQKTQLPSSFIPAGLVNLKMEFVENDRNSGRFSPLLGQQQHVRAGHYKFKVQSIKKKAALQEEDDRITLKKSVVDSVANSGPIDQTDQNLPRSSKFNLTDIEIGMKKEIIVPSFRTTVDIFAQHFLILRELKHRIELLHQAYYAQMDKKKTWEQVNEIISVLSTACTYLDFPEQKDASKFMIRQPQEPEKRQQQFLGESSGLSPQPMFRSSGLGVPKELTDTTLKEMPRVDLIQEEEEDEERNEEDDESREKAAM